MSSIQNAYIVFGEITLKDLKHLNNHSFLDLNFDQSSYDSSSFSIIAADFKLCTTSKQIYDKNGKSVIDSYDWTNGITVYADWIGTQGL